METSYTKTSLRAHHEAEIIFARSGGIAMIEATSCGGVVIFRGKILVLYKNYKNKYEGWVLPKGTVEAG